MNRFYLKLVRALCKYSLRFPFIFLLVAVLISIPAIRQVRKIKIRTSLLQLLPRNTRAAVNTRELSKYISSDGGSFVFLISQTDKSIPPDITRLHRAVEESVTRISKLKQVRRLDYRLPSDFVRKYRLMLLPERSLKKLYEKVLGWKSEASPAGANLLANEGRDTSRTGQDTWQEMESNFKRYAHYFKYHRSLDGYNFSIRVYTKEGASSFEKIMELYNTLQKEVSRVSARYGFFCGIDGPHRNKIAEYNVIKGDLSSMGLISMVMILLLILLAFRSLSAIFLVLLPLITGLSWGLALVPVMVGNLNLITAFLMIILMGMGIDYSIHLVKRFRAELKSKSLEDALFDTYHDTGKSVIISALTTALALGFLAVSQFRGFSDFGLITATSILAILFAMFLLLPSLLVLFHKARLLKASDSSLPIRAVPGKKSMIVFTILFLAGVILTSGFMKFDSSFSNLQFDKSKVKGLKKSQGVRNTIYVGSGSPAAIFVADNLKALDSFTDLVHSNMSSKSGKSAIVRISSIRDLSPDPDSDIWKRQKNLIKMIQDEFTQGTWWKKIKKPEQRRWAEQIRTWKMPMDRPVDMSSIPKSISGSLMTWDGSGKFLVGIHPKWNRKHGTNAMAFTQEIYSLKLPGGIHGPIGETPIFAEILWIVGGEIHWITLGTLAGVFLLILFNLRSFKQTIIVLAPLLSGLFVTFGILVIAGIPLNLFSVLVIPALLGMGIDDGVHYMNHWKKERGNTLKVQRELFIPLTATTFTTLVGYSGMMFAGHPGIRSIGLLACLGLFVIWALTLFYMPALLDILKRKGFLRF